MHMKSLQVLRKFLALVLIGVVGQLPLVAGVIIRPTQGITMTGVDGVRYESTNGITMTGVDALLGFYVNGITSPFTDGITMTGVDGITMTGVDGSAYTGTNTVRATQADGITMTGVDGITMTGVDGITMTGVDGQNYGANSVTIREADGITMTDVDGIVMTGGDVLQETSGDGITMTGVDGITMTGVDTFHQSTSAAIVAVGLDGVIFNVPTNGITMTGVDGVAMTGSNGITMTGVDGITMTGVDRVMGTNVEAGGQRIGLQSFDPVLAKELEQATDDRHINAVIVYHRYPTASDFAQLEALGIRGGTRFRLLPMVVVSTTPDIIDALSDLPTVRSVWGNRTLQWAADNSRELTGVTRVRTDGELLERSNNLGVDGRGVTVAVIDTGLDATHPDLARRVVRSVKLADLQGANLVGFHYPTSVETLGNTDQVNGHGTFVSGVIAGDGTKSGGKFKGVAPGAQILGLSAGDASLFYVLAGIDFLLERGASQRVRVLNCSFSTGAVYDADDPVNVATKMLTDNGISVVFSAGNEGPGLNSLNPYAVAPWVISVGATDALGRLASFSSRGAFGSQQLRPTLVAPGVTVVSLRSSGAVNVTGIGGVTSGGDTAQLSPAEALYYTTASGTSFTAPQVAGTIALMLQANPSLTPAQIKEILQSTATPLAPLYAHEVGAGMLNAHAAVLSAAFPGRSLGQWRATLDRGQVTFVKDPLQQFTGTVIPGASHQATLQIPEGALMASVQIAWGPLWSANDLSLMLYDPANTRRAHVNLLNMPFLTGRRERALVRAPQAGAWRVRVANTLSVAGTSQPYLGTLEVARAQYQSMQDTGQLSAVSREEIRQMLRTFVMFPESDYFRPAAGVTRAELAATFVRGGRVPQYVPGTPSFMDVSDATTMNYVESVQHAPVGALFPDAMRGGTFRPDAWATRVMAAVAFVRAAGLSAEAAQSTDIPLEVPDWNEIPAEYRGYVNIARERGFLTMHDGSYFHPQAALTRAELAHAMSVLQRHFAPE